LPAGVAKKEAKQGLNTFPEKPAECLPDKNCPFEKIITPSEHLAGVGAVHY
jgi:hypothetical protein